ncbi:MAG: hypothetical protein OXN44_00440 [Acidimicrobiaceae bacterium]|nr:hypothetical protein [Acidimicrobiaceae bacterium]
MERRDPGPAGLALLLRVGGGFAEVGTVAGVVALGYGDDCVHERALHRLAVLGVRRPQRTPPGQLFDQLDMPTGLFGP